MENPFTPTFGEIPAYMAGRSALIRIFARAFDSETRSPDLSTIISGARGTGKTALLSYLAEEAQQRGWIAVNTTALPGMLEDIIERTKESAAHMLPEESQYHLTGIGIGQLVNVEWSNDEQSMGNWRTRMNALLDQLAEEKVGLLITVDEIQPELNEMIYLAAVYQHFVRERRKVALLMAGLPHNVSTLLQDKSVSFLRRAVIHDLGRVEDVEIMAAFKKTVESGNRHIEPAALDAAVEATDGFPFMMQLVGYRSWEANPDNATISCKDVDDGVRLAKCELKNRILSATYRSLSDGDIRFLIAMLDDDEDSKVTDIAQRLGVSNSYAGQYRRRLLAHGVIGERRKGYVGFELPYFKEYLIEQELS